MASAQMIVGWNTVCRNAVQYHQRGPVYLLISWSDVSVQQVKDSLRASLHTAFRADGVVEFVWECFYPFPNG